MRKFALAVSIRSRRAEASLGLHLTRLSNSSEGLSSLERSSIVAAIMDSSYSTLGSWRGGSLFLPEQRTEEDVTESGREFETSKTEGTAILLSKSASLLREARGVALKTSRDVLLVVRGMYVYRTSGFEFFKKRSSILRLSASLSFCEGWHTLPLLREEGFVAADGPKIKLFDEERGGVERGDLN